jgi:hypothetical protein
MKHQNVYARPLNWNQYPGCVYINCPEKEATLCKVYPYGLLDTDDSSVLHFYLPAQYAALENTLRFLSIGEEDAVREFNRGYSLGVEAGLAQATR